MILRRSATPDDTALTDSKAAPDISARVLASDVLPLPGGPQRSSEGRRSASRARRSTLPGPMTPSWPANSSSVRGRILAASGATGRSIPAPPCSALPTAVRSGVPNGSGWGWSTAEAYAAGPCLSARAEVWVSRYGGGVSHSPRPVAGVSGAATGLPIGFAHRGAPVQRRYQNTVDAFRHAASLGASGIESDVALTEDGVAVLIHPGLVARLRRPVSRVRRDPLPAG